MNITTELIPIEGTHLHRRFQGEKEISPIYQGPDFNADIHACEEADQIGQRSVTAWNSLYVKVGGEWYVWNGKELG